jgi:hypothetical protein
MPSVENNIKAQALVGLGNARYVGHGRGTQEDWYFEACIACFCVLSSIYHFMQAMQHDNNKVL